MHEDEALKIYEDLPLKARLALHSAAINAMREEGIELPVKDFVLGMIEDVVVDQQARLEEFAPDEDIDRGAIHEAVRERILRETSSFKAKLIVEEREGEE